MEMSNTYIDLLFPLGNYTQTQLGLTPANVDFDWKDQQITIDMSMVIVPTNVDPIYSISV
jgi:hypothetical protein